MNADRWIFCLLLGLQTPLRAQPAPIHGDFEDATLRQWVQPDYPDAAKQAKLEGEVVVEFVVESDGQVSRAGIRKSTDERFNANALTAVQHWVFVPAWVEGKPAASGMQASVVFELAQLRQKKAPLWPPGKCRPVGLPVTPPKLAFAPDPDYPAELAKRWLSGQVVLEFTVEADGTASAPKVLWAPHAAFVGEALRCLEKYRFEPAHQGPLPLKSGPTRGQMQFAILGPDQTDVLAVNQISVVDPEKFHELPQPAMLTEPVYPRDLLLEGETGSASVEFTVTNAGATTDILLQEASRPEFGLTLLAAVASWRFDPAHYSKQAAEAKLVARYKFAPPTGGPVSHLMSALQPGGAGIGGAAGLDQRLHPIWRLPPVYPQALLTEKPAGQAVIEFIIDRDGRARLPRVVSASREEFGWAAATAIGQWVFAPPLRGGQPVEVKVNIPVDFAPPKD